MSNTERTPLEFPALTVDATVPQIHRAILAVVRDMPVVEKAGKLEITSSKTIAFTKIDDIRDALNPILADYGVISYPRVVSIKHFLQEGSEPLSMIAIDPETKTVNTNYRPIGDGKVRTTRSWSIVEFELRFVFAGDGSEVIASAAGEAYDTNSDKATAKATTAAVKRILIETFKITDKTEGDAEEADPEAGNRAVTTDRREGGTRGQQQIAGAQTAAATGTSRRSGPQQSMTTTPSPAAARARTEAEQAAHDTGADRETGELPEPNEAPAPDKLTLEKGRVREFAQKLALDPATINAIATEVTGKATREEWIVLPTAVKKLADELERRASEGE